MTKTVRLATLLFGIANALVLVASDLNFSDPARQQPAPAGAVGYPSRDANLDVLPGFQAPPTGYGEVPFYWWLGDPLTKERLSWELDQLKGRHISALQVNYAHSDKGGQKFGLTYPSDPPLFSESWWRLFGWFLKEAHKDGMAASLSDYTLGWPGQGWYFDQILKETPAVHGSALTHASKDCPADNLCEWELPAEPVSVVAYRKQGASLDPTSAVDLRRYATGRSFRWTASHGDWRVIAVYAVAKPASIDPMHPLSGRQMIAKFFQPFEDRNPGEAGHGLNFFFSDELDFGIRGWLWNKYFAEEFEKRKGYDILPELPALFEDVGPRTPKIRLDYSDVMVSLEEENYFRPLFNWHHSRGMMYGCDHGGRGRDITEFGDYFRTQRWMTAPGNDQPRLQSDVIKDKVASSITHLYQRPRTWLEGYHSSGWGTSSADVVDATWRNFALGHNLLTLHGLYYSTHGGWWEWAPPSNHFRMPYWQHMTEFLRASERMSYLLSQGHHRADVAILYPVAAVQAGDGGKESVKAAFDLGTYLYGKGIDFDFMDFESLARAQVKDRELRVSGERYRVLVLPAMRAVRYSTIEKALEFHRAGGIVVALGPVPEESDRVGRNDPQVEAAVKKIFDAKTRLNSPAEVEALVNTSFPRDFVCDASVQNPYVLHRKAGSRDIYMVYGVPKGTQCAFRSVGSVELWDVWSGSTKPLPVLLQDGQITRLRMPLETTEAQLIVFTPGKPEIATSDSTKSPERIPIEGAWEFELKPTLDNRWGDFRLPASNTLIGAEARRFRYAEGNASHTDWASPSFDDSRWPTVTESYGPHFWKLGPFPATADLSGFEARLAKLTSIDPSKPIAFAGAQYRWQPYQYSMRWGIEEDPGHQGYHGLKAEMPEDFIALGKPSTKSTTIVYEPDPAGVRYFLWASAVAPRPMDARLYVGGEITPAIWINGVPVPNSAKSAHLARGSNPVLLRYDKPGRSHFMLEDPSSPLDWKQTYPLASRWFGRPGVLPLDTRPTEAHPSGWYRFTAPPGLRSMKIAAHGSVEVWIAGKPAAVKPGAKGPDESVEYTATVARPLPTTANVTIRISQQRGVYGGAAIPEPISLECRPGKIAPGDWSLIDGLASYSGGAFYRKAITLTQSQAQRQVVLDLGKISASVEVHVNGQKAGVRVAPPWKIDISRYVRSGENQIELLVFNTLSNYYQTIPTRYRGSPVSGLIGPVSLEIAQK